MSERAASSKSADAYRTISEVAEDLGLPQHVLRFWETRFPQVKPLKRAGGRRFYRPDDVELLRAVKALLYDDGYTIKGVQRMLRDQGPKAVTALTTTPVPSSPSRGGTDDDPIAGGEALGRASAGGSVDPSMPDGQAAASMQPLTSDCDGDMASIGPTPDSAFRPRQNARTDVAGRLQGVLDELTACERLILQVRNPSPLP